MLRNQGYMPLACFGKWHVGMTFFDQAGRRITDQKLKGVHQEEPLAELNALG
jgi:hypothetical protein